MTTIEELAASLTRPASAVLNLPSMGYSLALRDGSQWYLSADQNLQPWLKAFAAIMELDASSRQGRQALKYALQSSSNQPQTFSGIGNTQSGSGWEKTDLKTLCLWSHKEAADMLCELKLMKASDLEDGRTPLELVVMINALYPIYRQSIRQGGLPFHAALVAKQGCGVLLAAPGGTGKSTCCRRLPDGWVPLGDDEALVVVNGDNSFRAHPFPTWSEHLGQLSRKTWNVQSSVRLCGIFFLEQAETDAAAAIGQGEAAALANQSVIRQACGKFIHRGDRAFQRSMRQQIFNNIIRLVQDVPAFKLRVSLNGRFWEEIEKAMGW